MAAPGVDAFDVVPGAASDPATEADRVAYFDLLRNGFERAAGRPEHVTRRCFRIADRVVCVAGPSASLVTCLTRALGHQAISPCEADFTICVWDDASSCTRLPLLIRTLVTRLRERWFELLDRRREIKEYDGERIRTSFFLGPDILSALDLERNVGLYWIESEEKLPYWERGSPFLALLSWWMASQSRHYVHAGAVGYADGGVLLAGRGGSGKSTTALACLQSDLLYVSDDYCLVSTDDPTPRVHSVYSTAKLKAQVDLERFPHLRDRCSNLDRIGDEKALLFLEDGYADRISRGFPIRAVVLPCVAGESASRARPATAAEAFRALAPSTLMQVPGAGPELLESLRRLVQAVPAFHLDLGPDVSAVPVEIQSVLARLSVRP